VATAKEQREWYAKIRQRVLDSLGGRCVQCGICDSRVLQIDHVFGGGNRAEKVRRNRKRSWVAYYYEVIRDAKSGKYQLLCANCNWIKKHEQNEVRIG
jgi:hypothetical protein